ncbi:MAG: EAL domain-containing protein [Firmicutes bacterium]|nr:EAL domain-containing protein [Bacillota bacterium]
MYYNLSYLCASLAVLFILGYHYLKNKQVKTRSNRLFRSIYVIGVLDIVLDILTSYMIMDPSPDIRWPLQILLTLFYIIQITFPYVLFLYTISLQERKEDSMRKIAYIFSIVPVLGVFYVIGNIFYGYIFNIDSLGVYSIGFLYSVVYIYSFCYLAAAGIFSMISFSKLSKKDFITVWEFLVIVFIFIAMQYYNGSQLTIGLGITLGIVQFYLNTNNPRNTIDQMTDTLEGKQFPSFFETIKKSENRLYMLTIDLYNLKEVNHLYGSYAGDDQLMTVANRINRNSERIYSFRITGNRFLVCSKYASAYRRIKEDLISFLEEKSKSDKISIDSLLLEIEDAQNFKECDVLLNYIEYLYSVTKVESGFYHLIDNAENKQGFELYQSIESYVTKAVESDLFELHYQPIYSTINGQYQSLEALTRLFHPKLGKFDTELIFEIARRKGFIEKISTLQLRKIARFLKDHPEFMHHIDHVKYNVSPIEIMNRAHMLELIQIIKEEGIPCSTFKFELTEEISTIYNKEVEEIVNLLSAHDIRLALDDFGTGYSSIYSVLSLPFEIIKMDRSLLKNIESDKKVSIFYKRLVDTFHNLGYLVVSEGVETEGECKLMKQYGVDYIQGYYYSRPLSEKEIIDFIQRKNS